MTQAVINGGWWRRLWPLLLILLASFIGWLLLSQLAFHARVQNVTEMSKGPTTADYNQGKTWATDLFGLAGVVAGFLGVSAATLRSNFNRVERAQSAQGGMIGILAGATLLGVGGWPVPVALLAMGAGVGTVRVVNAINKEG